MHYPHIKAATIPEPPRAAIQFRSNDSNMVQGNFSTKGSKPDIQLLASNSKNILNTLQLQKVANNSSRVNLAQGQANNTGLPDNLKSGIENLSGYSMDDVKVHYNSNKPAQLNAHAYAQGTDIHIAPGQEKHLPHEAWHVIQQKQGRVRPTVQMKGVDINDDEFLEREADFMGDKAQSKFGDTSVQQRINSKSSVKNHNNLQHIVQRYIYLGDSKNRLNEKPIELVKLVPEKYHDILDSALGHSIMPIRGTSLMDIATQIKKIGSLRDTHKPWRDVPDDPNPIFYGVASPDGAPRLRGDRLGAVGRLLYMGKDQGKEIIDFKNISNPKLLLNVPYSETIQESSSPLGLIDSPKKPVPAIQPVVSLPPPLMADGQQLGGPPPPPPLVSAASIPKTAPDPKSILRDLRKKDTFNYHEKIAAEKISAGITWKNPYVDKGGVGKWFNTSKRGIDWATTRGKIVYFALDNLDDTLIPGKEDKAGQSITASELRYTCRLYLKYKRLIPGESLEGNFGNILFLEKGEIVDPPWIQKPGLWNSYIHQVLDKHPQLTLAPLKEAAHLMLQKKYVGAGELYKEVLGKLPKELWTNKMRKIDQVIDEISEYQKMDESSVGAGNLYISISSSLKNI